MKNKIKHYSCNELSGRKKDLEDIKKVFDKLNLRFFLIDGVLLGAIREQNFIKWDWDVELGVFEEEIMSSANLLLNELFNCGFQVVTVNPFSSFFKINIIKRGTKFSLIGLKRTKNKWRYRAFYRYPAKLFDDARFINFLDKEYLAPYPTEEMLTFIYGQWQVPLKSIKNSEYLTKNVRMPKFLYYLIKIRHFFTELNSYFIYVKMKIVSKFFPNRREYLFSNIMLKKALSEDCIFLEIGSSDGFEMSKAIKFTNGKIQGYLVDPSIENLEKSKKKIKIKNKRYNANIKYFNKAVSRSNNLIGYYFSYTSPNLSGIKSSTKHAVKRLIKSTTIKDFFLNEKIPLDKHIVIKMDVEGAEVEILQSSIKILSQISRVSILLEVHPHIYKGNEMKIVLNDLFSIGFNTTYVETAWIKYPEMFIRLGFTPVASFNNRALYSCINNDIVSNSSSREILNIGPIYPYFTKKIVRSILIEKQ